MTINQYATIVRNANIPTDEKALAQAFEQVWQGYKDYDEDDEWLPYADETADFANQAERKRLLTKAYLRGMELAKAYAALAANPVYLIGTSRNLVSGAVRDSEGMEYEVLYLFASEEAAKMYLDQNRQLGYGGKGKNGGLKILRVPMFVATRQVTGAFQKRWMHFMSQRLEEVAPGSMIRLPMYGLVWLEDGKLVTRYVPGHYLNVILPASVLGACDPLAADSLLEDLEDESAFDEDFEDDLEEDFFDWEEDDDEEEPPFPFQIRKGGLPPRS